MKKTYLLSLCAVALITIVGCQKKEEAPMAAEPEAAVMPEQQPVDPMAPTQPADMAEPAQPQPTPPQ